MKYAKKQYSPRAVAATIARQVKAGKQHSKAAAQALRSSKGKR